MSLVEHSAVELRALIQSRQISPVELLDDCIARMQALNPAVNALCATDFERARSAAKLAEEQVGRRSQLPLLHGLPLGVTELQATEGLLTTRGFADVLEIARERKYELYDLFLEMPAPLVPRPWRAEAIERLAGFLAQYRQRHAKAA